MLTGHKTLHKNAKHVQTFSGMGPIQRIFGVCRWSRDKNDIFKMSIMISMKGTIQVNEVCCAWYG